MKRSGAILKNGLKRSEVFIQIQVGYCSDPEGEDSGKSKNVG